MDKPQHYINREMSWLAFNRRVLEEAQDKTNPLLERLKFLAITASNMDEFFMIRVSGLISQAEANITRTDPSGLTPREQLAAISEIVHDISTRQYNCLNRSILPALAKEGLRFMDMGELTAGQLKFTEHYFNSTIYPILTPMAIDQSRPFPLLNNKSLNIIVELKAKKSQTEDRFFAVVQTPTVIPRVIELPAGRALEAHTGPDAPEIPRGGTPERHFVFLEEVIREYVHRLFTGYRVLNASIFRITRNSDFDLDEEDTEDLLMEIEKSVKGRKWGEPVRIEIERNMVDSARVFLEEALKLDAADIYEISGPLDLSVWMSVSGIKGYDRLRNAPLIPRPAADFLDKDVFEAIAEKDILVHHPYDSFDAVLNFVRAAAQDPEVLAIKMTLYRVSGNSPVVETLAQAAENGKQVTVLVELKARFDEENNILWARRLDKAGCHVIYGLVGLKTHCKICLVVRKEDGGIRRYIHLSTGNYNDSTAKIYTDIGFFTSKETFGQDITALFNLLTGYSNNAVWKKIVVAPTMLRETLVRYIDNEAENARTGRAAMIIAKMNSLVDTAVIQSLYNASAAGVKIKLIVRGICCLRSGVPGVSENITVVSIVDRFLEHSRIFYFENGGAPKLFLSSADWMPRNLDRRVEVAFPVEDAALKEALIEILDITLSDTVKLRVQQPDGSYEKIDRRGKENIHSQLVFGQMAEARCSARQDGPAVFKPVNTSEK
ncbi:MAG: RNA degradosome polyphosphate kinase [Clostridiales bacterium]|jgi:polyphosphate kinase|nr:RNA degradosome polyphosphate kinase [Clostridiales bacterium]